MRKSSRWIILVALLTITAPTAFADSFSIVFNGGTTTPVDTSISVFNCNALNCLLDLGTVTDIGSTFTMPTPLTTTAIPQNDSYQWQLFPEGTPFDLFIVRDLSTGDSISSLFTPASTQTLDSGKATVMLNTVAAPVPEPSSLLLLGTGLLGLAGAMRRKRLA